MKTDEPRSAALPIPAEKLQELVDHHELTKVLNSYVHCADEGRWEDWESLFSAQGSVEMPQGAHRGREGLGQWAAESLSGFQSMMHFSGNHEWQVAGDSATGRSKVIAVCVPDKSRPDQHLIWGGVYTTALVREGGWKIAALRFDLVWSQGTVSCRAQNDPGTTRPKWGRLDD